MQATQIVSALATGSFTAKELNDIANALKFARTRTAGDIIDALKKGSKVQFTGRRGELITGTVRSMGSKNVVVDPTDGTGAWRVSATLLTVVG
jgi:hypothetical protein